MYTFSSKKDAASVNDLEVTCRSLCAVHGISPLWVLCTKSTVSYCGMLSMYRQLYWVESGTNSIWRYSLDNLLLEVFASSLDDPSGLVIDHQSKLLYWTELSGNIRRISLDGSGQELIYNNSAIFPFKIALYRDYVLWIDGGSGADSISVLHRERLEESGSISVVPPGSRTLTSLLVVGSNRQMTRGKLSSLDYGIRSRIFFLSLNLHCLSARLNANVGSLNPHSSNIR